MTLSLRSTFSPAQPWARQDAPFSPGGDGEHLDDPSKLACFFFLRKVDGRLLRFAMDAGPYPGGRLGDGETHCSKVRSDEVQDGPSCGAKQR